jgi:hypothetical protein
MTESENSERQSAATEHESPVDEDAVAAMNEYRALVEAAGVARENALDLHDRVQALQWVAAGGLGTASTKKVKELAEALRKNAETLEELADDAPEAREVRDRE